MFTDIVGSTNLVEALGDEAWETMLRWHDTALREVFTAHGRRGDLHDRRRVLRQLRLAGPRGRRGDRDPAAARRAPPTQGFAPQVRIGLHASDATQVGGDFHGKGVHEAARIAALGGAGEIVASVATVGESHRTSGLRSATLKGLSEPIEVVNVDWR